MNLERIRANVEKHRARILKAERDIWKTPEPGYREVKTNAYMKKAFEEMGYTLTAPEDITGFYTVLDTGREGPTVLVLAELDSLHDRHSADIVQTIRESHTPESLVSEGFICRCHFVCRHLIH